MSKWEMVKLGDVASFVNGYAFKPSDWVSEGIPIVRIQNLTSYDSTFNYYNGNCQPKYEINNGDVLISWSASLGVYKWNKGKALLNQHIFKVIFDKLNIDKDYFIYTIKFLLNEMSKETHGSTMKHITKSRFDNVCFPLPPLEIQKKIAQTLDVAAELIALRKKQLAELDNLIKATFYDMFGDPVTNEKGWEVVNLREVCDKITDGTHNSPENLVDGKYMYITAKHIKKYGIDIHEITYVSEEVHKSIYNRCNPEYGDILYIKDGATTGIAQVNTLKNQFSMLSSVALLKQNRNLICNFYMREVLNNENMYYAIRKNMGGAAITRLTLVKISKIKIPLPPLTLQNKFAEIVTKIEEQKARVQKAIDESQYLFDSLMSAYFE